jgi:glycosyltransferase involved in cell wall biosynthesis
VSFQINSWIKKRIRKILAGYYQGKGSYRLLTNLYRMLPFKVNQLIPSNTSASRSLDGILRQANVYHSPYSKITDHVNSFAHLKHFITIHDLIPILYPAYNTDKPATGTNGNGTRAAVQSLKSHHWIFTVSESTKNDLCNFRPDIDPDRVLVNYLGASRDKFSPCTNQSLMNQVRNKYGIPSEGSYFLSLGNLAPHKNFDGLIKGFHQLIEQEKLSDTYLVVVGRKGPEYDKVLAQTFTNPVLRDKVIFTGRVEDDDLAALYSGALCFAFTSHYEGFGLPPLEAMQCGAPVIVSNASSLPEIVGDAGILVNPKDTDALSQAMLDVCRNSDLRANMSEKSILQAGKFSWEACVRRTMEGYQLALDS